MVIFTKGLRLALDVDAPVGADVVGAVMQVLAKVTCIGPPLLFWISAIQALPSADGPDCTMVTPERMLLALQPPPTIFLPPGHTETAVADRPFARVTDVLTMS